MLWCMKSSCQRGQAPLFWNMRQWQRHQFKPCCFMRHVHTGYSRHMNRLLLIVYSQFCFTCRVPKTHAQVAVDCLLSICQFEADCINVIMPIPILLLCLFSYYAYYILMLILLLCLQACSVHIYKLLSCYAWQACYVYIYIYIYIYAHIIFLYMCTYIYTISCSLENAKVFSLCSQYIIMFVLCVCIYIYIYT
jgi:hypothetical protein